MNTIARIIKSLWWLPWLLIAAYFIVPWVLHEAISWFAIWCWFFCR